jgi:hypothetical protein
MQSICKWIALASAIPLVAYVLMFFFKDDNEDEAREWLRIRNDIPAEGFHAVV